MKNSEYDYLIYQKSTLEYEMIKYNSERVNVLIERGYELIFEGTYMECCDFTTYLWEAYISHPDIVKRTYQISNGFGISHI